MLQATSQRWASAADATLSRPMSGTSGLLIRVMNAQNIASLPSVLRLQEVVPSQHLGWRRLGRLGEGKSWAKKKRARRRVGDGGSFE